MTGAWWCKRREWLIKDQSPDCGIKKTKKILAQTIYFCLLLFWKMFVNVDFLAHIYGSVHSWCAGTMLEYWLG